MSITIHNILPKQLAPICKVLKKKQRVIKCYSYVVKKRPLIVKDVIIRGTLNSTAALGVYLNEQTQIHFDSNMVHNFIDETFKLQLLTIIFNLIYDIYYEYNNCVDTEECQINYDNVINEDKDEDESTFI